MQNIYKNKIKLLGLIFELALRVRSWRTPYSREGHCVFPKTLMALLRKRSFSIFLLLFYPIAFSEIAIRSAFGEEEFSEELLLKPLPDRKVLAHFHFQSKALITDSFGRHHHLFPKAISQLVCSCFSTSLHSLRFLKNLVRVKVNLWEGMSLFFSLIGWIENGKMFHVCNLSNCFSGIWTWMRKE